MACPTRQSTSSPSRALAVTLLVAAVLSACASDPPGIESESVVTTSTMDGDVVVENSSTTSPSSETEQVDTAAPPGSIWGVEAGSYDLIRFDTESGDIVQRIAGWGAASGSGEQEGGAQALQQIATAGDSLWVADCCEPAVGTVFRVDPGTTTSVPDSEVWVYGTTPVLSPDGTRLAVSVLDIGVAVHDATTGRMIVSPELIATTLTAPEGVDGAAFATPVSWVDGDTIAVALNDGGLATVTMVSIAQPSVPTAIEPVIEVDGTIIDGATRSDGAIVVAVESRAEDAVAGQVYSSDTGIQEAVFALDPATTAIDYDASGTFLLVARENLRPTLHGLGKTNELGHTSLVFAAWDDY